MLFRATLLVIALWQTVDAQYVPTYTVTCSADGTSNPVYTVEITAAGSATGIVFINGACASQATAATGTYTFNTGSCTTVPAFATTFQLVFQQNDMINLDTDHIVDVTCDPGTAASATATISATGDITADGTQNPTLIPGFTVEIQDQATSTLQTGGAVGDLVKLAITIDPGYVSLFGFTLTGLTVETTGGTPVALVTTGCSGNVGIIPHPAAGPTDGSPLEVNFGLFVLNTGTPPIVPTTATAMTFTLTLGLCNIGDAGCPTAPTCAKRKRRSEQSLNVTEVELTTAVVVLPRGDVHMLTGSQDEAQAESDVCFSKAPFYGLAFALVVSMLTCLLLAVCVFYRWRRQSPRKDIIAYDNTAMKGTY